MDPNQYGWGIVGTFAELDFCAGSMDQCVFLLLLHPETVLPHGDSFVANPLGGARLCSFSVRCTLWYSVNSVNIHSFVDNYCLLVFFRCNGTTHSRYAQTVKAIAAHDDWGLLKRELDGRVAAPIESVPLPLSVTPK